MAQQKTIVTPPSRIKWLSDLVRLEIALWDHIDARLKQAHDLPLAFFEALYFIEHARDGSMRIGDLARALRVTVGGTSKVVDRIERAGLIRREPDTDDRRASRVALTDAGRHKLTDASKTYEAELATMLDAAISTEEQQHLYDLVTRLLVMTTDR